MSAAATTELTALPPSSSLPTFFDNLDSFAEAPEGVAKLRELILDLAVRGKLVEQDKNDESTASVVEQITSEKQRLIDEKRVRKSKAVTGLDETEIPFAAPAGWTWSRLEDVKLDAYTGIDRGKASQSHDRQFPYFKMNNMTADGRCDYSDVTRIDASAEEVEKYTLRDGDFLFNTRNSAELVGKTCVFSDAPASGFLFNNNVLRIAFGNGVSSRFANLWFCSPQGRELLNTRKSSTTNVAAIYQGKLMTLPFPLPPLSEQRRIVEKVDDLMSLCDELESRGSERVRLRDRASRSCLDRLVSSRSRRDLSSAWQRLSNHFEVLYDTPETLAHLRLSILQLAVQGKLVPQDPNEEPASALIAEIQTRKNELVSSKEIPKPKKLPPIDTSKLPFEVPSGWEWLRLESVCEVITKGSSPKWQGVSYLEGPEGGIMFITSENVGNYVMRKMDAPKFVEAKFNEMEPRSILQRDDILVNLVGASIGRSAIWNRDDIANINQAVGIVRLVPGCRSLNRRYLLNYLNSPTCLAIMFDNQVVTAQPNISLTNVKHFLVPLPPLAEQKRIVAKVDQLLSHCAELSSRMRDRQSETRQLLTATIHQLLQHANAK